MVIFTQHFEDIIHVQVVFEVSAVMLKTVPLLVVFLFSLPASKLSL